MKLKKIGIVVLAAAVLMAMTVSIAYAQGYSYGPNMVTHFSGSSATLDSQPSGSYSVNTGDTLGWGNVFYNSLPREVSGYVQDYTTPSGGLVTTLSSPVTVPKDNIGTGTVMFVSNVADGSSSHTIAANHLYKDGYTYYGSPYGYGMSFS